MEIITTTSFEIPGRQIVSVLGIVKGNTVRAKHLGKDIGAALKNLAGGEIKGYTDMTAQARDESFNRMVNEAIKLEADAVINVRFATSMVMSGASEMLAYGTAVKLK